MTIKKILLLGNPKLYEKSLPVKKAELSKIKKIIKDLHDTLFDFRKKYNAGRAISAPQINVFKRIIYMYIDNPVVFINPELEFRGKEKFELWDDCMSFPGLLVKVRRYKNCKIKYRDLNWNEYEENLSGNLSELLQHEYDHLNGILATQRAIDKKSFKIMKNNFRVTL